MYLAEGQGESMCDGELPAGRDGRPLSVSLDFIDLPQTARITWCSLDPEKFKNQDSSSGEELCCIPSC